MRPVVVLVLAALFASPARGADQPGAGQAEEGQALTLAEAIRLADERNINLRSARLDLAKAQANLYWAWSTLLPTADATLGFTHNDHADKVDLGDGTQRVVRRQENLNANIQVNLPLVNARAWLGVSVANMAEESTAWSVEVTRQALLRVVAETYYAALTAMQLIEVSQTQIRAIERHLQIAVLRHRTGTGDRIDVVRTKTELVQAKDTLVNNEALLDSTRYALATLLAQREKPMPRPAEQPAAPPDDEAKLVELALDQREDLKLQHALVRVADRSLSQAWMSFMPSLNASWQLNQQITDTGSFSDPDQTRWFIGLTLSVPLYDNTRYADLDSARAELTQKQLQAEDAERQAVLQVQQAWVDWRKALKLAASAEEKSSLAAETLKLTEVAYASGSGGSLEVTDARRVSQQADLDLAVKRFDAQLALIALLRVTGYDMTRLAEGGGS